MIIVMYGIDVRNFNTGIHGLLIFKDKTSAEESLELLREGEDVEMIQEEVLTFKEIDFREINRNNVVKYLNITYEDVFGDVITEERNIKVVNKNSIEVYM